MEDPQQEAPISLLTKNTIAHKTMTKKQVIKNLIAVSISCFLLFLAYDGLIMLQSTMNSHKGTGVLSQASLYSAFCISSLILPKYFIKRFGNKKAYVLSIFTYIPYIASNFLPYMELMIPTSIIIGLGASVLWVSQCNYLNDLSKLYTYVSERNKIFKSNTLAISSGSSSNKGHNELTIDPTRENCSIPEYTSPICTYGSVTINIRQSETITALFFGFHGFLFMSCNVWSNMITYFILREDRDSNSSSFHSNCSCGVEFCNEDSICSHGNISEVTGSKRYILTTICVVSAVLSVVVAAFCMNDVKQDSAKVSSSNNFLATLKFQLNRNSMLLMPASIHIGMLQGFYVADFTKSFTACSWGIHHVGLVSICFGALSCFSSSLSGWLVRKLSRVTVIITAYIINLGTCALLLVWDSRSWSPTMLFVTSGLWGSAVGAILSQLRAFYGVTFKEEEEAAFSSFHLCYSLGYIITFSISSYVCIVNKLYLLFVLGVIGLVGYFIVERLKQTHKK